MIKKDYYEVLGLSRTADASDIKKAYRQMAMKYHPDRNPGDHTAEESFKEASEAYEVLSDPEKRQIFDRFGHQGLEGRGFHGFSGTSDIFSSFGDIFEEFFGGFGDMGLGFGARKGARRARSGADLRHDITISFEEAAFGVEKEVTITKDARCEQCEGTGVATGSGREVCRACNGTGQISHRQGFFMIQTACAKCRGEGSIIKDPCKSCHGLGKSRKSKKLSVKIPAGVEDGMRLILRGEGEMGTHGGSPGDMYVFITVQAHKEFWRDTNDIHSKLEIGMASAALGVEVAVATLYGAEKIGIPAGTQSGDHLKMKGKGVPDVRNGKKGDHIIEVKVVTPKKLSKKQKQLLEEFIKESK